MSVEDEGSTTEPSGMSGAAQHADQPGMVPGAAAPGAPGPGPVTQESPPVVEAVDPEPEAPTARDPRVDDALSRLSELEQLPLDEQVEVYADVHRRLAAVLSDPDGQAQ